MPDEPQLSGIPSGSRWRQWVFFGVIVAFLGVFAVQNLVGFEGVHVTRADDAVIYRASAWWLVTSAALALLMLVLAITLITVPHPLARALGLIASLAALSQLAVAPSVLTGGLKVRNDGFDHTVGFWWSPETQAVEFDALAAMEVVPEPRRSGTQSFTLKCYFRNGETISIPKSTVLEAGLPVIFRNASESGVIVEE